MTLAILSSYAQKDTKSVAYLADRFLRHADVGVAHSLHDGAHGKFNGFASGRVTF